MKKQIVALTVALAGLLFLSTSSPNEHLKYGIPGTCSTCQTLYREGYVVCEDTAKKVPLWVSYHLTKDYLAAGTEKRANYKFLPDPDLAPGERATNKDYSKSGYDKGHMCPAADESRNPTTMKECFYLSNMCPQWPQLNRHPWEQLEVKVRALAAKYGEIWVIVGPIFEKNSGKVGFKPELELGPDHVWVPWGFYKIVIFYSGKYFHALAFQYKNQDETNDIPAHTAAIDTIQAETGLDFLSALPENEQKGIESITPTAEELVEMDI
jgi:endonuclease G